MNICTTCTASSCATSCATSWGTKKEKGSGDSRVEWSRPCGRIPKKIICGKVTSEGHFQEIMDRVHRDSLDRDVNSDCKLKGLYKRNGANVG